MKKVVRSKGCIFTMILIISIFLFPNVNGYATFQTEMKTIDMVTGDNYGQFNSWNFKDEVLDQQHTSHIYRGWGLFEDQWVAQGFKPRLNTITRVELYIFKAGNPPGGASITVSIRSSLGGSDLVVISISGSGISPSGTWVNIDFSDIDITPESLYYIVVRAPQCPYGDCFAWLYDINNPYTRGDAWGSFDGGSNWWEMDEPPDDPKTDCCFKTYGINNAPDVPSISGEVEGTVGESYDYTFCSTDQEDSDLFYYVDWDDGSSENWVGPYTSGDEVVFSHTWERRGSYTIQAKAKDVFDTESEWGTLEVKMPVNQQSSNSLFLRFLERFPNAFPMLRYLLGL